MDIRPEMLDLVRAFDEARLAALHIDMQPKFSEASCKEGRRPTEQIFPIVKNFAIDLRSVGIPNHWVAYTGCWQKNLYSVFRTANPSLDRSFLSKSLRLVRGMANDDEMVFEKAKQGAFQTKIDGVKDKNGGVLAAHLREVKQDTIIIDGVKDKHCVTDTIVTGLEAGFRFYVALNATNCPFDQFDEFADWFNRGSSADEKRRVTFTSTTEVLDTLKLTSRESTLVVA